MRLGDADREELFQRLSSHAAQGHLDLEELERRVERVAAAGTREEAATVLADLPPLIGDPPPSAGARPRRGRGHGDADSPDPSWRPTSERFRDPRSNRIMRVWEDAAGARHYVADDQQR
jgi:hypothetical protein